MHVHEIMRILQKFAQKTKNERHLEKAYVEIDENGLSLDYGRYRLRYTPNRERLHFSILQDIGKTPDHILDFATTTEDRQALDYVLDRFVALTKINAGEPTPRKLDSPPAKLSLVETANRS